ncbi:MAG: serine/threonine protein kinase [Blastocatellia bacterium]|nr:serine/threonine protein kinase [Blastocatellia bacterium]
MKPDDWQKIEALFQMALEIPLNERISFLDRECPEHLRSEVETLLLYSKDNEGLLDRPVVEIKDSSYCTEQDPIIGSTLGQFRIARKLGQGGMASVYLGIRESPYKQLGAVKVLNRDLDSKENRLRFFRECQILAILEHPNIPKLLDGDTSQNGTSYFVMDYIEGRTVCDYADVNKLTVQERLRIFLEICSAVSYVHRKNIVHCDIKPSNILVNSSSTAKLLDFGIAIFTNPELSTQAIDPTAPAERRLTRRYASPEQLRGDPIRFSTDIYALGVILYELLTGHYPEKESLEKPSKTVQMEQEILGSDARKRLITSEQISATRSTTTQELVNLLEDGLDEIVLKAMREEVQKRYLEVDDLANAIKNFLDKKELKKVATSNAIAKKQFLYLLLAVITTVSLFLISSYTRTEAKPYEVVQYDQIKWEELIESAKKEIVAEGIYLESFNPSKLTKLAKAKPSLKVKIMLLDPGGDVVVRRERDEGHLNRTRIMQKFLDFDEQLKRNSLKDVEVGKFELKCFNIYPTIAVVMIDDDLYAYFYSYGELGTGSPVIKVTKREQSDFFRFFEKHLQSVDKASRILTERDFTQYKKVLEGG